MVKWIFDSCQFTKIAHESRLLLALHIQFNQDIQWSVRYIVHGWIVRFAVRLNRLDHCVRFISVIFSRIRIIGGNLFPAVVDVLVTNETPVSYKDLVMLWQNAVVKLCLVRIYRAPDKTVSIKITNRIRSIAFQTYFLRRKLCGMNPTFFISTLTFFLRAFSRVPFLAAGLTADKCSN